VEFNTTPKLDVTPLGTTADLQVAMATHA
jgi:hypothetical protein